MKKPRNPFSDVGKAGRLSRAWVSSSVSFWMGLGFAVCNGFLGIRYRSVWNGSICVYYALLAIVKGMLIHAQRQADAGHAESERERRRKTHTVTHILLFVMHAALTVPLAVMIGGGRTYSWGLIPAIAMATYTTYRTVMSVTHLVKAGKAGNLLLKELRTVNLIDALVAVLTLQNTMILANDGEIAGGMKLLSILSSTAIWGMIAALSVRSFLQTCRNETTGKP